MKSMENEVKTTTETYRKELRSSINRNIKYTKFKANSEEIRINFRVRNSLTEMHSHKTRRRQ